MLSHLRVLDPNIEHILDIGFSPSKDYESTGQDKCHIILYVLSSLKSMFTNFF